MQLLQIDRNAQRKQNPIHQGNGLTLLLTIELHC